MLGCAHIQWHTHSVSSGFWNGWDPCAPCSFPPAYAQPHTLTRAAYVQPHILVWIFLDLHDSQQPQILDPSDSWKNFYDLTFWMKSLVHLGTIRSYFGIGRR